VNLPMRVWGGGRRQDEEACDAELLDSLSPNRCLPSATPVIFLRGGAVNALGIRMS
jgi:hypothetical protein